MIEVTENPIFKNIIQVLAWSNQFELPNGSP